MFSDELAYRTCGCKKMVIRRCKDDQIEKTGKSPSGEQGYRGCDTKCSTSTSMLKYRHKADETDIGNKIIEMALNRRGVRDTTRVLGVRAQAKIDAHV